MSQYPYETALSSSDIPDLDEEFVPEPVVVSEPEEGLRDELEDEEVSGTTPTAVGHTKTIAARPNRAMIRKIVAKALEVETAPEATRALAAALLGSSTDTIELTTAIMTAPRGAAQPLTDIGEVATALIEEAWEAGVIATSFDTARQKAVWGLLHARGAVTTPAAPKSLPKAGSAIVRAINSLDATDKAGLADAGELLKRS